MKDNYELMNTIQEVSLEELDQIIGAGKMELLKLSHMNVI
ncbi:type A2 lanthipeptide [Streptococcus equi]